jgi:hypothetical protein
LGFKSFADGAAREFELTGTRFSAAALTHSWIVIRPRSTAQTTRAFAHTVTSFNGGSVKVILAVTAILIGVAFLLGSCA